MNPEVAHDLDRFAFQTQIGVISNINLEVVSSLYAGPSRDYSASTRRRASSVPHIAISRGRLSSLVNGRGDLVFDNTNS